MNEELDPTDLSILRMLQENPQATNKDIGTALLKSQATIQGRRSKMTLQNIITGYTINLNPVKLKRSFLAIITLNLADYSDVTKTEFLKGISQISGVNSCTHYSGTPNMGLNVTAIDKEAFVEIEKKISALDKVNFLKSHIILEQNILHSPFEI